MQRQMLKSKVHHATITACDVDYVTVLLAGAGAAAEVVS